MSFFLLPDEVYRDNKTIDPTKGYMENMKFFYTKLGGTDFGKDFRNGLEISNFNVPTVEYYERDSKTFDKEITQRNLIDYLRTAYEENLTVAPSLTCYRKDIIALDAKWTVSNIKMRNEYKSKAKSYMQAGNAVNGEIYNAMQKTKKIFNNGLSGSYALKNSPLSAFSNHYTLTATTRVSSGIGNILSERMISGNRFYRLKDDVIDEFITYIRKSDQNAVKEAIEKYQIHIPTTDEIIEMVKSSSKWYWDDETFMGIIQDFVDTLTDIEKAIVLYSQDIYHLKKYNEEFINRFFGKLTKKVRDSSNDVEILKNGNYDILNTIHMIHYDELKGVKVDYDLYKGTDIAWSMVSTYLHVEATLKEYEVFIDAFFKKVMVIPSNVAYVKDMVRETIELSDTDSTCAAYFPLISDGNRYRNDAKYIGAISGPLLMLSGILRHTLRIFAANTNTNIENYKRVSMKAEYYWGVFIPLLVSKHYMTSEAIKEMFVLKNPETTTSGVSLIASTLPAYFLNKLKEYEESVITPLNNGELLSASELIRFIADLESLIENALIEKPATVLRADKMKEENGYKNTWDKSNFFHHILWQRVFARTYGDAPEPPYRVYKLPLKLGSVAKIKEFIESIEDPDMKREFENVVLKDGKKKMLNQIKIPMPIANSVGVPKELQDAIDIKAVILNTMKPFYMILDSLGLMKYSNFLVKEQF